ncbi:MAG: GGDEF domain-containing protein [Acidobacteriota bacterium]
MQVLIADDDVISRRMLANKLTSWGYQVLAADDGAAAWAILERQDAPRLAILDWMMPGLTGPALCRQLRELRREHYTYVLLLTARTDKEDVVAGLESGADDYLTKPFDEQELQVRLRAGRRILELEAELVAAREALREQATRDQLTSVWNRSAILEMLHHEASRAAREGTALAVIMADLDHFKLVNDRHGHPAGDAALREAARRMQACLRSYDRLGRYGGEEFLVVLPGFSKQRALQLAVRLRSAVAEAPVRAGSLLVTITVSLGVTATEAGQAASPETLIRLADSALYRAKETGRDRVEWAALEGPATGLENLIAAAARRGSG